MTAQASWDAERPAAADIAAYFMSGVYDCTVRYVLAKDYLDKLRARAKAFYTFEHSAHSPLFEELEKFGQILPWDVLAGAATLADLPVRANARPTP